MQEIKDECFTNYKINIVHNPLKTPPESLGFKIP